MRGVAAGRAARRLWGVGANEGRALGGAPRAALAPWSAEARATARNRVGYATAVPQPQPAGVGCRDGGDGNQTGDACRGWATATVGGRDERRSSARDRAATVWPIACAMNEQRAKPRRNVWPRAAPVCPRARWPSPPPTGTRRSRSRPPRRATRTRWTKRRRFGTAPAAAASERFHHGLGVRTAALRTDGDAYASRLPSESRRAPPACPRPLPLGIGSSRAPACS